MLHLRTLREVSNQCQACARTLATIRAANLGPAFLGAKTLKGSHSNLQTKHVSFSSTSTRRDQFLLCPGPVSVKRIVLDELSRQCVPHRENEFREIYGQCQKLTLKQLGGIQDKHFAAWTTGSGTCAVESVISSYLSTRRTLLISQGSFGERWQEVCQIWGVPLSVLRVSSSERIDLEEIQKACIQQRIQSVLVVHHETSAGIVNRLKEINDSLHRLPVDPAEMPDIVVDAVSSFGCEEISLNLLDRVSFVAFGINKGLEAPPGLCCIAGSVKAFKSLEGENAPAPRSYYLDLRRIFKFAKNLETSTTPAVNTFFATLQALRLLDEETVAGRRARMLQLSRRLRKELLSMGYQQVLPRGFDEQDMSCYLTNFYYPGLTATSAADGDKADAFHNSMEAKGIFLYRGKDDLLNKSFQVCTMGEISEFGITLFLQRAAAAQLS